MTVTVCANSLSQSDQGSTPGVWIPVCARGDQVWMKTSKLISSFPQGWNIKDRRREPHDLQRCASCIAQKWFKRVYSSFSLLLVCSEQQVKAVRIQPLPRGYVMTTKNGELQEQEVAWTDLKISDMWGWVKRTSVQKCLAWRYNHQLM